MGQDWPTDCNVLTPALHHVSKLLLKILMTVCRISAPRYSSFCYCDKMLHVDSLMEEEFILDLDSEVWVHLGVDREGGRTVHTQSGSRRECLWHQPLPALSLRLLVLQHMGRCNSSSGQVFSSQSVLSGRILTDKCSGLF